VLDTTAPSEATVSAVTRTPPSIALAITLAAMC
jgi:hypothetical protein